MKRLHFLVELSLPSQRAYAVNVTSTLAAIGESNQVSITLYANKGKRSDVLEYYQLPDTVALKFFHVPSFRGHQYFLSILQTLFVLFKSGVVAGRFITPIYLLSFFRAVHFEYHSAIWKQGKLFGMMFRHLMRSKNCKSMIIPNKNLIADFLSEFPHFKAYSDKVHLISNGSKEKMNLETKSNATRLSCGYIGSFYPGKGLEVIEELVKMRADCDFYIAGGPAELLEMNHPDLLKAQNVKLLGYLPPDQTYKLASEVDVFLLPNAPVIKTGKSSDIGRYTNPLKLYEYMSFYKPVICSDQSYLSDVLGDFGFYCNTLEEWSNSIDRLSDHEHRRSISSAIKQLFLSKYTIEKRAELVAAIWSK